MDLQTLKNNYAQEHGFPDWEGLQADFYGTNELEEHMDEICIRAQKAYRDNILEKIHNINFTHNEGYIKTISAITNPENLIL